MIEVRGVVMRLEFSPPRCVWLRADPEVLLGDPWGWTEARREASVFPSLKAAEEKARECGPHAHAVVTGVQSEAGTAASAAGQHFPAVYEEERRLRHQAMLERMGLE